MTDEQLTAIEQRAAAATIEPLVRKLERAVIHTEDDNTYFSLLPMLKTMKALVMDMPALVAEVRRLREARELCAEMEWQLTAGYGEALALFEAMKAQHCPNSEATPNQTTVGAVLQISNMVAGLREENKRLRSVADAQAHELDRFVLTADEDDIIENLILRLRRTTSDGELYGIEEQDAQMRYMLRSTFASLMADVRTFRADVERIGRERDQMVAANVELQERLSALEDDLK